MPLQLVRYPYPCTLPYATRIVKPEAPGRRWFKRPPSRLRADPLLVRRNAAPVAPWGLYFYTGHKVTLQYIKLTKFNKTLVRKVKAIDILYQKMAWYDTKALEIYDAIREKIKKDDPNSANAKAYASSLVKLAQLMRQADELAIECAHKLAPYESPKLETLEVKSKVEHRFVIRTPQPIKSAEEWNKVTGTSELDPTQIKKDILTGSSHVPSIHDFVDDDEDIDKKRLN